jgi:hypothetical protein
MRGLNLLCRVSGYAGCKTIDERLGQMAENDAWYIFGVDKVINEIEVRR